jgi:histidinol-phosphate aminotransferase
MAFTRRGFLSSLGAGAMVTAGNAIPPLAFAFEPTRAAAAGNPIILDSNENAYGAPESAFRGMREALSLSNRYPDFADEMLVEKLAAMHKVTPEQIILGCGSGELLKIAAEAFTSTKNPVVTAHPTFEVIARVAERNGAAAKRIPLNAKHEHDLDAMLAATTPDTGLAYICNPNNPTANITPRAAIEKFLAAVPEPTVVMIDEAYHHFVDSPDYVSFLDKPYARERLIILRTFSKIYGMAGLRVGYGVAPKPIIAKMQNYAIGSNVNCVAGNAALAALDDRTYVPMAATRNARDRAEFERQAKKRNLTFIPSQSNFVMLDTKRPVRQVIQHFRENNIRIGRPFAVLDTHARISLSTPADMEAFWRIWDKLPARA